MKLTYILPTLGMGGAEIRAIERLNALSVYDDWKITLLVLSDYVPLLKTIIQNDRLEVKILNLKNAEVFSKKALRLSYGNSKKLYREILKSNPDIIVASLPISHFLVRLAYFGKGKSKPKLWMYHHAIQYQENPVNTISKKILHIINKQLGKKVDFGHIFISEAVRKDISENMYISNGHILFNAIPDKLEEVKKINSPLKNSNFNIIIPGRLTAIKGHIQALNALKQFIQKRKNVKIWIIGDGAERKAIQDFISLQNIEKQIEITGNLPHQSVLRSIYDSDVVLVPSLSEGLGNVAIESLMMKAVSVVSNAGGLPEIINDNKIGLGFNRNNFSELEEHMEKLYSGEIQFEKNLIRSSYLNRFTLDKHISSFIQILNY